MTRDTPEGEWAADPSGKAAVRVLGIWLVGGLAANFAWEMLHMHLYAGIGGGWARCAAAAASDVSVLAFLYAVIAAAAGAASWFREAIASRSLALAAVGFLTAVTIELRALSNDEWSYEPSMPLLPFFEVGVSPVLQMVLIPLVLTWLSRRATAALYYRRP
jgi:hypothetical protein